MLCIDLLRCPPLVARISVTMERFTISLDEKLAEEFDAWIAERGYSNRSEAVRDLLRAELGRTAIETERSLHCVASLSYVFNHHERDLCAHYLFDPDFCNVASGWEKGVVEKNVQDSRRRIWIEAGNLL